MTQPVARSHCHACGTAYANETWPRTCPSCALTEWRRIDVVAVMLQPVTDDDRSGVLVIERGIEPHLGQYALPGGFVEFGEAAEDAACRELNEETGVHTPSGPLTFLFSQPTPEGQLLILFEAPPLALADIERQFSPSSDARATALSTSPGRSPLPSTPRPSKAGFAARRIRGPRAGYR